MSRLCLKLQCLFILEIISRVLMGCWGTESGVGSVNKSDAFPLIDRPCFIFDPTKLPKILKPDVNVTCLPDKLKTFPDVPDLLFQGVKYSSIDFKMDTENPPGVFAFNEFGIYGKKDPARAAYLKRCNKLYDSVWMSLRSLDPKEHMRSIRELETVTSFINLQVRRLEGEVPDVEAALNNALKKCFQCTDREKYNLVALSSQSGVDPDKFLKKIGGLRCKSRQECLDLLNKKVSKNSTPLDSPKNDLSNLVILNPAVNHSSRKTLNFLLALLMISINIFISY